MLINMIEKAWERESVLLNQMARETFSPEKLGVWKETLSLIHSAFQLGYGAAVRDFLGTPNNDPITRQ